MSKVFWDSNLFIYLIEDSGDRGRPAAEIYERMRERSDAHFTSALTLSEVLVRPIERRNEELRARDPVHPAPWQGVPMNLKAERHRTHSPQAKNRRRQLKPFDHPSGYSRLQRVGLGGSIQISIRR